MIRSGVCAICRGMHFFPSKNAKTAPDGRKMFRKGRRVLPEGEQDPLELAFSSSNQASERREIGVRAVAPPRVCKDICADCARVWPQSEVGDALVGRVLLANRERSSPTPAATPNTRIGRCRADSELAFRSSPGDLVRTCSAKSSPTRAALRSPCDSGESLSSSFAAAALNDSLASSKKAEPADTCLFNAPVSFSVASRPRAPERFDWFAPAGAEAASSTF